MWLAIGSFTPDYSLNTDYSPPPHTHTIFFFLILDVLRPFQVYRRHKVSFCTIIPITIYISNLHAAQILLVMIFLLNIHKIWCCRFWWNSNWHTYVDLSLHICLYFQCLYTHTTVWWFVQYPFSTSHIFLFFDIAA